MRRWSAAAAASALLLGTGCVQGSYNHVSVDEPVRAEQLSALQLGQSTLADCLRELGAPHRVFEYHVADDGQAGMALLWFWRDAAGWGIDVSGGTRDASGSVSFDQLSTDLPGCLLWFGADLRLERWRTGMLGDLLPGRRRPSARPAG